MPSPCCFDVDGTLYHQGPLRLCMALELAALPLALPGVGPADLGRDPRLPPRPGGAPGPGCGGSAAGPAPVPARGGAPADGGRRGRSRRVGVDLPAPAQVLAALPASRDRGPPRLPRVAWNSRGRLLGLPRAGEARGAAAWRRRSRWSPAPRTPRSTPSSRIPGGSSGAASAGVSSPPRSSTWETGPRWTPWARRTRGCLARYSPGG